MLSGNVAGMDIVHTGWIYRYGSRYDFEFIGVYVFDSWHPFRNEQTGITGKTGDGKRHFTNDDVPWFLLWPNYCGRAASTPDCTAVVWYFNYSCVCRNFVSYVKMKG